MKSSDNVVLHMNKIPILNNFPLFGIHFSRVNLALAASASGLHQPHFELIQPLEHQSRTHNAMPAFGTGSTEAPSLPVLATKRVQEAVKFPFTAYSHAHDLLAIVTEPSEVTVYRIVSGQTAFTVKRGKGSDANVTALAWKVDGSCLAVGWNDGSFEIYDGGSARSVHTTHIKGSESDDAHEWRLYFSSQGRDAKAKDTSSTGFAEKAQAKVVSFGWMGHEVGSRKAKNDKGDDFTTDDWYDDTNEQDFSGAAKETSGMMDLPRAIATLDVTKVLPRLAAVPVSQTNFRPGPEGIKYANQATTDAVFDAQKEPDPGMVESLVVAQEDGTVDVLLDETVKIGTLSTEGRPILHAAHPNSPSHVILNNVEGSGLQLSYIDLPLSTFSGAVLHVIASNTKRIQSQLDYITYTLRCIEHDYNSGVEMPNRYLSLLAEELENDENHDPVFHFYNLAMTGTFNDLFLEWLKDMVKDTGLKRWEPNVNTMYLNMSNHLFVNLLPALDRITVAITTLRGYARLHDGSSKFDVPAQLFSNILEHIDSLRLVAQRMQLIVMTEHKQFRAFIKWLRLQLDIAIAGPASHSALETEEREVPNMDYGLVLAYIKHTLLDSKVSMHIKVRPSMEGPFNMKNMAAEPQLKDLSYEHSKEALLRLEALKEDEELTMKEVADPMVFLNIPALAAGLTGSVRVALQRITEWQSRMLVAPTVIPLNCGEDTAILDMIHYASPENHLDSEFEATTTQLLALDSSNPDHLDIISLIRSPLTTTNLNRRLTSSSSSTLPPPTQASTNHAFPPSAILAAKWLLHEPSTFLTLFRASEGDNPGQISVVKHHIVADQLESEVLHLFPAGFKAEEIIIGGRKGKLLCIVFGNGRKEWRVLDLDGGKKQADGEDFMELEEQF